MKLCKMRTCMKLSFEMLKTNLLTVSVSRTVKKTEALQEQVEERIGNDLLEELN